MFLMVFMKLILLLRVHFPEALFHTHLKKFFYKKKKNTSRKAFFKKKSDPIMNAQNWDSEY